MSSDETRKRKELATAVHDLYEIVEKLVDALAEPDQEKQRKKIGSVASDVRTRKSRASNLRWS